MLFLKASDCYFHKRVVSRGMVSPAVVSVSFVGKNVVLRIHILSLEVGPFIFHSPTILLSRCTTSLPSLFLPCIFFIAAFSCKAWYFPEYLTPKSSTTKVKFIGRLLCFHSMIFFLRGGIHTDLGVLTGRHVLSGLLGWVRKFPLFSLHRCIHCVLFLRYYIFNS